MRRAVDVGRGGCRTVRTGGEGAQDVVGRAGYPYPPGSGERRGVKRRVRDNAATCGLLLHVGAEGGSGEAGGVEEIAGGDIGPAVPDGDGRGNLG